MGVKYIYVLLFLLSKSILVYRVFFTKQENMKRDTLTIKIYMRRGKKKHTHTNNNTRQHTMKTDSTR